MADWQKVAGEARKAAKTIDRAIGQLDREINAAIDAALEDGKITKRERERIDAMTKQSNALVNARTKVLDAAIAALDRSPDLAAMRQRIAGIRRGLANREEELKRTEQVANTVGRALSTVAGILVLLV